jgi:hypothetical protein
MNYKRHAFIERLADIAGLCSNVKEGAELTRREARRARMLLEDWCGSALFPDGVVCSNLNVHDTRVDQ